MNAKDKRKLLLDAEIIEEGTAVKELLAEDDYYSDLLELEEFFQTYLRDYYKFQNPVFVFGSKPALNAWAWAKNDVNAVCINYASTKLMRRFFESFNDQINSLIIKFGIHSHFDNVLSAGVIMMQVSEMFLFYHETGHLIQAQNPILQNNFTEEEIRDGAFDIIDHVSELDADLYACRKLVTHLLEITKREQRKIYKVKYLEDLVIVTIIGYMIYRLILNAGEPEFYLKAHSHPHMSIRMTHAIIHLTQATIDNSDLAIRQKRILATAMSFLEDLGELIPEYVAIKKFVDEGRVNHRDILHYLYELQELVVKNPATAHFKTNLLADENI